jgi:hypothetical protein
MVDPRKLEDEIAAAARDPRTVRDTICAVIAGGGAARLIASSVALFEAGGKHLLDEGAKSFLRSAAERGAEGALALAAGPLGIPATMIAKGPRVFAGTGQAGPARMLANARKATRAVGPLAARTAGKELLKGAGRAAGLGFVIDGALAGVEAAVAVRSGSMDRKEALQYVAKEATTGAVATGAGALMGASLVVLTGGAATPVVFAVGALGTIGAKRLLRKLTDKEPELSVREMGAHASAM